MDCSPLSAAWWMSCLSKLHHLPQRAARKGFCPFVLRSSPPGLTQVSRQLRLRGYRPESPSKSHSVCWLCGASGGLRLPPSSAESGEAAVQMCRQAQPGGGPQAGSQRQAREHSEPHRWGSRAASKRPLISTTPAVRRWPGSGLCCNKPKGQAAWSPKRVQASAHEISAPRWGLPQRAR